MAAPALGPSSSGGTERVLVVHLTTACNLRCVYCFQRDKRPRALAWGPLRAGLEWALASGSGKARVVFTGGEPLLAFPLLARAVAFVERERPKELTVATEILTNGLLLDDDTLAFVADHDLHVSLSFDGRPAAQDLRGKGTFAPLDRLMTRLARERPFLLERRLVLALTVCRQNVPFLADSFAYLVDAGATRVTMSPAMTADDGWTAADAETLERQLAEIYRTSVDHYTRTRRVVLDVFRKTAPDPCGTETDGGDRICSIGDGHALAVDVGGRAVPCPLFAQGYHTPGNPLLDPAAEEVAAIGQVSEPCVGDRLVECGTRLHALPVFGPRARKHSSWGRCADCEYLGRCHVCPVAIGLISGNTDPDRVPDFQCAFTRTSLAYRDRFPVQSPLEEVRRSLDRFWASVMPANPPPPTTG